MAIKGQCTEESETRELPMNVRIVLSLRCMAASNWRQLKRKRRRMHKLGCACAKYECRYKKEWVTGSSSTHTGNGRLQLQLIRRQLECVKRETRAADCQPANWPFCRFKYPCVIKRRTRVPQGLLPRFCLP